MDTLNNSRSAELSIPVQLGRVMRNADMRQYTSFKIGGPADLLVIPETEEQLTACIDWARKTAIPWTILGGGANILVSDKGIRGLTILSCGLQNFRISPNNGELTAEIGAGMDVSKAAELCAEQGISGLDFLYGMPGTIGGAVWMNARCYGSEISQILEKVRCWNKDQGIHYYHFLQDDWAYKKSPFQNADTVILAAEFHMSRENSEDIRRRMNTHYEDRKSKGHFTHPSAGSTFKNDYDFGKPSGQIVDELQLRGKSCGDAQIAPYHGNIFINTGQASASDMKHLILEVQKTVREQIGVQLEPEVLFIGQWD